MATSKSKTLNPKKKRVRKKPTATKSTKAVAEAPTKQKELLTVEEVMILLDISRNTFDKFRKEGVIKVYRLGGRRLYSKYSEIMKAIDESQLQPA